MNLPDDELAIRGGRPVRDKTLPYGRQTVGEEDRAAVDAVLRSDWLTTGPKVAEFERAFAEYTGAAEAVAVSSGTAALHAAMHALGIGPGDEVIVPAMTFAATANTVVFQAGTPVFADVDAETLLLTPATAAARITPRTKAIVAVDYAGQPCDYDGLRELARKHGLALVADACHSAGARFGDRRVGALADLTAFSFHPVKQLTTGEGGMVTTLNAERAARMRIFRNHGITSDHRQRENAGSWFYEMPAIGFNYRLSDIACALGLSQLQKLDQRVAERSRLAQQYREALASMPEFRPLAQLPNRLHAYHLFVVRCNTARLGYSREQVFSALRAEGIAANVHYIPVHLHRFYRERFQTRPGQCPAAELAYEQILTLPLFPGMDDGDVADVCAALRKIQRASSFGLSLPARPGQPA